MENDNIEISSILAERICNVIVHGNIKGLETILSKHPAEAYYILNDRARLKGVKGASYPNLSAYTGTDHIYFSDYIANTSKDFQDQVADLKKTLGTNAPLDTPQLNLKDSQVYKDVTKGLKESMEANIKDNYVNYVQKMDRGYNFLQVLMVSRKIKPFIQPKDRIEGIGILIDKMSKEQLDNRDDEKDRTSLMIALQYGWLPQAKQIIAKGVDLNLTDRFGKTALEYVINKRLEAFNAYHESLEIDQNKIAISILEKTASSLSADRLNQILTNVIETRNYEITKCLLNHDFQISPTAIRAARSCTSRELRKLVLTTACDQQLANLAAGNRVNLRMLCENSEYININNLINAYGKSPNKLESIDIAIFYLVASKVLNNPKSFLTSEEKKTAIEFLMDLKDTHTVSAISRLTGGEVSRYLDGNSKFGALLLNSKLYTLSRLMDTKAFKEESINFSKEIMDKISPDISAKLIEVALVHTERIEPHYDNVWDLIDMIVNTIKILFGKQGVRDKNFAEAADELKYIGLEIAPERAATLGKAGSFRALLNQQSIEPKQR